MAYKVGSSQYTRTYTTFSGCDLVATFGAVVIGELQAISYSISREKAPVYTLGSAEPRSFSRGKRGIAGSLVFTAFDRDALLYALKENAINAASFQRIGGELNMQPLRIDEWDKKISDQTGLANLIGIDNAIDAGIADQITNNVAKAAVPYYCDEIPPFDITISFANEYGQKAVIVIYGVEILNEGTGYSIDSIISEKACTFVARRVESMKPVESGLINTAADMLKTTAATAITR